MSDLQTGSNASPVASFAEQPSQNSQLVVKAESGGTSQLYMEFTDDTPPPPQATTLVQISNMTDSFSASQSTSVIKQERPDPRKEWINSDPRNPYYCKLCDYSMDCMDAFQGHCMGAKHIKRAVEVFNIKLPKKEEEEKKKNPPQFHCQVCLVTCNSDTAWNAHLLGQKHRKVLEKQSAEKAQQKTQERNMMNVIGFRGFARGGGGGGPIRGGMFGVGHSRKPYDKPLYAVQQPSSSGPIGAKDFATYPEPLIGLEYVTEIQVIGQSPRYHCELCDSKFDHNLKFPHLVGSKHRFNVLKEKNPAIAQSIRGDIKKRSELSSKLLEEARQLERQEGRQQVKTRVEKSPFNRINNQAATHQGSFIRPVVQPAARGGSQQWQSQRGGRGGGRGRGKQSAQSPSYNNQQQFFQQQQQQQPLFNRGGRGRGRGRGFTGTNQTRSWGQSYSFSLDTPNMTFPSGSHGIGYEMDQGQGDRMLPVQAFQPRSPPRSHDTGMRSSHMIDMRYDDFYGGTKGASTYSTSNLEHHDPRLKQSVDQQQKTSQQASATGGMGLLQGALADIGKLVSSEEDASMALQVSNALTHALLQFRMQNMPQESSADSFSGGGSGAQMNTDS